MKKRLADLFKLPKRELATGEVQLTLIPSTLTESDEHVTPKQKRVWWLKAALPAMLVTWAQLMPIIAVLMGGIAVVFAAGYAETFGAASLLHAAFLSKILLLYMGFLVINAVGAGMIFLVYLSPSIPAAYPYSLYLTTAGFAVGDPKALIPWANVRSASCRQLVFKGTKVCNVLQLEVLEPKYRWWQTFKYRWNAAVFRCGFNFMEPASFKLAPTVPNGRFWLPLDIFAFEGERARFLHALQSSAGITVHNAVLPSATAASISLSADSFTTLWLNDLRSSSGNRDAANRVLEAGHALGEGKYTVEGVLGHGGLSVVYSARTTDGARVAVKEIVINSGGTRDSKEAILRRILTEVELLRKLDHPNIVRCIDFFSDSGRFYIVLEACEGKNLRDYVLENGALSERAAIEIGIQCCAMLTYLHGMDPPIIHRDFTPDNMVRASSVRPDIPHDHHLEAHQHLGTPQHLETPRRDETTEGSLIRLIDFNVAEHANAGSSSQTIVGKHCFLAPEQWCGTFTVSGDVYQLGCTLYFLVTGQDPEPLKSCDPPDSLSPEFRAIIRKLTAREVADRYSHASEVAAALGALPSAKESAHA